MKTHIVLAHPEAKSFNAQLSEMTRSVLEGKDRQVTTTDLYAMSFDPCEGPRHYATRKNAEAFHVQTEQRFNADNQTIPSDVQGEIDRLLGCDLLVVHFPLWWFGMPAILKGWIDRVFVYGCMYRSTVRYDTGVCAGKRMIACVTTGAIFGIYSPGECDIDPTQSAEEIMKNCTENATQSGENLVAAGYCMFSSSCVFMITTGHGVFGFTLDEQIGEFVMSHEKLQIPDGKDMKRIYSGNNGNVELWAPELREYVKQLQTGEIDGRKGDPWSYRYIGALIGDFHRTLLYGGIWLYPPDVKATEGKARLLYEVAPIAMIAEQANGMATRGKLANERVMEVKPMSIHQKSPMFVGSTSAVKGLQKFLQEHKK